MYKLYNQPFPFTGQTILRIADNSHIPFDEANTDYQAYLAWLEEGNKPEAAD